MKIINNNNRRYITLALTGSLGREIDISKSIDDDLLGEWMTRQ